LIGAYSATRSNQARSGGRVVPFQQRARGGDEVVHVEQPDDVEIGEIVIRPTRQA
jgi:hypothetical protein